MNQPFSKWELLGRNVVYINGIPYLPSSVPGDPVQLIVDLDKLGKEIGKLLEAAYESGKEAAQ